MNIYKSLKPKITIALASFIIALLACVAVLPSQPVLAAPGDAAKAEACKAVGGCDTNADKKVNNVISSVINIISLVIGVVAVIMIMIAGFKYVTSGGDSGKVSSAKNSLVYAVIGLIIVTVAQVLVRFVVSSVA